jgi:Zn-dependent alcohol dehydrogenase
MKTRAAVAWKAGEPLSFETIEIDGPKAGEVLVEIKATGNLPHRRVHAVGRRSGRALPGDLGS